MQEKLNQLKEHLARVSDLTFAYWLLSWDQRVMMPPGGAAARADQSSTLQGLAHQFFTSDEVGQLLEDLTPYLEELDGDSDEARIISVNYRNYQRKKRIPVDLAVEIARLSSLARQSWHAAKEQNDFGIFQPHLEQMLDLMIQKAEALAPDSDNPYDGLLDDYEAGMDYAVIDRVFSGLKPHLVELITAVDANQAAVDDGVLHRHYDTDKQLAFSRRLTGALGYDYERGRMDLAAHPFTSGTSRDDVRITTRVYPDFLPGCVMASIHEAGHAMHFQNLSPTLYRSHLAIPGYATAESQSRFYENVLGRSRDFWAFWYPELQEVFPHLEDTDLDTFYRALNKSQPSLTRVEADEVTYGMHIMLRFELENEMINGRLAVGDLPEAWNARMEAYLGVTPSTDSEGVLQDVHWSQGGWGYFPDYLLGSILSSQLWERMLIERPGIPEHIRQGRYDLILDWLVEKIHWHGKKFTFLELAEKATGKPFTWEPYMDYLKVKYSDVYGL